MGGPALSLRDIIENTSVTAYLVSRIAFDPKFVEQCWIDRSNLDKLEILQNKIQARLKEHEQAEATILVANQGSTPAVWQEIAECLNHEMIRDQEFQNSLEIETRNLLYATSGDALDLLEYLIEIEEGQEQ